MARDKFVNFLAKGENPGGFVAVTPNGNSSDRGDGVNHDWTWGNNINGARWTMPFEKPAYIPFDGQDKGLRSTKRTSNRNRSGE